MVQIVVITATRWCRYNLLLFLAFFIFYVLPFTRTDHHLERHSFQLQLTFHIFCHTSCFAAQILPPLFFPCAPSQLSLHLYSVSSVSLLQFSRRFSITRHVLVNPNLLDPKPLSWSTLLWHHNYNSALTCTDYMKLKLFSWRIFFPCCLLLTFFFAL